LPEVRRDPAESQGGTGHGSEPLEPLQAAMLLRTVRMRSMHID
jgi:hypothetical protein